MHKTVGLALMLGAVLLFFVPQVLSVTSPLNPTSGPAGTSVLVTYSPSGSAEILWGPALTSKTSPVVIQTCSGSPCAFTVPSTASPGLYAVTVQPLPSGGLSVVQFTVTSGSGPGLLVMLCSFSLLAAGFLVYAEGGRLEGER